MLIKSCHDVARFPLDFVVITASAVVHFLYEMRLKFVFFHDVKHLFFWDYIVDAHVWLEVKISVDKQDGADSLEPVCVLLLRNLFDYGHDYSKDYFVKYYDDHYLTPVTRRLWKRYVHIVIASPVCHVALSWVLTAGWLLSALLTKPLFLSSLLELTETATAEVSQGSC